MNRFKWLMPKRRQLGLPVLLILGLLGLTFPLQAAQQVSLIQVYYAPLQYVFDDRELRPAEEQLGFIYENRTYVPLRFIAYALNKAVEWDPVTYTVSMTQPDEIQSIEISQYIRKHTVEQVEADSSTQSKSAEPQRIEVYVEPVRYVLDGVEIEADAEIPGLLREGTLFVPLRFLSESLGIELNWDPTTYRIEAWRSVEAELEPIPISPLLAQLKGLKGSISGGMAAPLVQDSSPSDSTPPGPSIPGSSGGSGIGGGGFIPAKPSQSSLEQKYINEATRLQQGCEEQLLTYAAQYIFADDSAERQQLRTTAVGVYSSCEQSFHELTEQLSAELQANDYSTEVVQEMREEFQRQKEMGERLLCGSSGCAGI